MARRSNTDVGDDGVRFLRGKTFLGRYRFGGRKGRGYDMTCRDLQTGRMLKIEVKTTEMAYDARRKCDLRKQLYFSGGAGIDLFQRGKSKVVRVFRGNRPPHVIMFDVAIQGGEKKLKVEPRALLQGRLDYGRVEHLTQRKVHPRHSRRPNQKSGRSARI